MHIEPYASFYGEEVDISKLKDRSVTLNEWENCRGNTPGFIALYPKLDDEAFIAAANNHLKNVSTPPRGTYEQSLVDNIVPELLKRINPKKPWYVFRKYLAAIGFVIPISVLVLMLMSIVVQFVHVPSWLQEWLKFIITFASLVIYKEKIEKKLF